jgi:mono/diheme cytochrome c family protein
MSRTGKRPKAHSGPHSRSKGNVPMHALMKVLVIATLAYATTTLAQSQDKVKAGLEVWKSSGCADCHGPFADGNPEDGDFPIGANLRTARLDTAGLKQTIRCGRPGTGMPSFDAGAYKAGACYGRPAGSAPDNLQPTPRALSVEEIDAVVAYLQERIVGHGKITREECLSYYEGKEDCEDLK